MLSRHECEEFQTILKIKKRNLNKFTWNKANVSLWCHKGQKLDSYPYYHVITVLVEP